MVLIDELIPRRVGFGGEDDKGAHVVDESFGVDDDMSEAALEGLGHVEVAFGADDFNLLLDT